METKQLNQFDLQQYSTELCNLYNEGFSSPPWNDIALKVSTFTEKFSELITLYNTQFNAVFNDKKIIAGCVFGDLNPKEPVGNDVTKIIKNLNEIYEPEDALWFDAFTTVEYKNMGICTKLFQDACQQLKESNKRRIWLTTLGGEAGGNLQEFWTSKKRGMTLVSNQTGNIKVSPADRVLLYKDL